MKKTNKSFTISVVAVGFLIWFLATLAPHYRTIFFYHRVTNCTYYSLFSCKPVLTAISVVTLKKFNLAGLENVLAGVLMVLPGMIINTFVIQFFEEIFPNMTSNKTATVCSWLI